MSISVKYFASLREQLGRDSDTLDADDVRTVGAVWAKVAGAGALPANVLAAINQEYARPDQPVHDGDEVAFFPPVTGG